MKFLKGIMNLFSSEDEQAGERNPGRNEACWCGSGRKYKKCHLIEDEKKAQKAAACYRKA
jgi:uncharacterized protein YchJ